MLNKSTDLDIERNFNISRQARESLVSPGRSHLRLGTITRLRWFAVIGQTATICILYFGLGFVFPVGWCLSLVALSAWLNIILRLIYPSSYRLIASYAALILGFDIWNLTALLYLTGGLQNPFSFLLLVPVTISASTQYPRITIQLGILAIGCATLLAFFHFPLPWYADHRPQSNEVYLIGLWFSVVIGITFMAFYAWRISRETQDMSNALAAAELVLAREQKLTALDGLAAAAAHELGTPLSTIILIAKELRTQCDGRKETAADLDLMTSQAERCQKILSTLSQKRGETDLIHNQLTIEEMINEAVEPYRSFGKGITINTSPSPDAKTDEGRLEPILERNSGLLYGIGNIVENAVDFAYSQVVIDASWDENYIKIIISDNGPGFAMEILDLLGEPYISSRHPPGREQPHEKETGLGLGFFIAKTLLERSGATLKLKNTASPKTGAIITLVWRRESIQAKPAEWFA
ncbi:MAG: ActS/PrrB/RegB family redox-sensitive histidine kinase [Hyphomicrobiaceae bacterium]|nr:ActS/PrrB/RegB family redox-sensitive histidine kinase [Hyphomicrobiaceae bacterium]